MELVLSIKSRIKYKNSFLNIHKKKIQRQTVETTKVKQVALLLDSNLRQPWGDKIIHELYTYMY